MDFQLTQEQRILQDSVRRLAERHFDPFLIKVPNIEVKGLMVEDDKVRKRMKNEVLNAKRKKLFIESCKPENIAKAVDKIDEIYKKSGVNTKGLKISISDIACLHKSFSYKRYHPVITK